MLPTPCIGSKQHHTESSRPIKISSCNLRFCSSSQHVQETVKIISKKHYPTLFFCWDISIIFGEKCWSLKHFGHLSHSCIKTPCNSLCFQICLLPVTVFLASIFRHCDQNHLISFGHFKIISVYDEKKQALPTSWPHIECVRQCIPTTAVCPNRGSVSQPRQCVPTNLR